MSSTPIAQSFAAALLERAVVLEAPDSGRDLTSVDRAVAEAELAVDAALSEDGSLAGIAASAELTPLESRVLALSGAVELDRRLQRLVAHLTADPGGFRLELDLVARLLGPEALATLAPGARLITSGLLEVDDEVPFAAARVTVPRTVAWALRGELVLDAALPLGAELVRAPGGALGGPELVLVHGTDRVRRIEAAITATWGVHFLVSPVPADDAQWRALVRTATVGGLGVILDVAERPDARLRHEIARHDHLTWALTSERPLALEDLPDLRFEEVDPAAPGVDAEEWSTVFPGQPLPARRPSATQLELAQKVAPRGDTSPFARLAAGSLLKHARRVEAAKTWDDLILPAGQERQLRELVDRYRHRRTVHEDWGLSLYPSPGVVALFAGPSGTGKTTSAEVIAHDLGIDLFRVDLSALVSKYIGETEKNLEEIFSAAHAGDYLLLFDEADSLFGSRSAVNDAKDRYANMEVSYLLQRLETYDGFVVLTSNFQGNIDEAFLRRIHASVHFPLPTPADRERIWEHSLAQAPRGEVDLGHLARVFELSGGAIRNAALTAAFLASGSGGPVAMPELLRAVGQELAKLRQRMTRDQLGRWADSVGDLS